MYRNPPCKPSMPASQLIVDSNALVVEIMDEIMYVCIFILSMDVVWCTLLKTSVSWSPTHSWLAMQPWCQGGIQVPMRRVFQEISWTWVHGTLICIPGIVRSFQFRWPFFRSLIYWPIRESFLQISLCASRAPGCDCITNFWNQVNPSLSWPRIPS